MPAGPLAILPLPGNRSSIVWSEEASLAAEIHALDDDAIVFVIKPRGWRTPLSAERLPQFYYIHAPEGTPAEISANKTVQTAYLGALYDEGPGPDEEST